MVFFAAQKVFMSCNWLVNSWDFLAYLGPSQKVPVCGVYIAFELLPWYFSPAVSELQVSMKAFGPLWLDVCAGREMALVFSYTRISGSLIAICWRFPSTCFWHLEIRWLSLYRFISGSSPVFHWSACLFLHHTSLFVSVSWCSCHYSSLMKFEARYCGISSIVLSA